MNTTMSTAVDVQGFLGEVEKSLEQVLQEGTKPAEQGETLVAAARHLCLGAGKRARPMLVRLFGSVTGTGPGPLLDAAVATELIHSASLLHDDVVDAGMFRRGRPTVNARWGNIVAVFSGDLLLVAAMRKLTAHDPRLVASAVDVVEEMTRGAIAEVEARGDLGLPLSQLRYIHEAKTGALFGWGGKAAALLAGNEDAAARFDAFGRRLGVAFQIADDIRDISGADVGKPQFADVQSRTPSLPILLAAQGDEGLRRKLRDAWAFASVSPEKVKELGSAVAASGALETASRMVQEETAAAVEALGPYARANAAAEELVSWADRLAASVQVQQGAA
ncbi:MAG: polyprenyl synthase family protein [Pseudomonadota bacterium]|jgi:octaprenyl-diphosphate synthase